VGLHSAADLRQLPGEGWMLPERIGRKIPLALVWVVPVLLTPVLIYSLKFFWRW
jgi:hypothetical protein